MSKLIENKHIIHIMSEIAVLLGITFYFNQQNQKLKSCIEDLTQRMEEQEDTLKRQEEMIKSLAGIVNNISNDAQDERLRQQTQNYQHKPQKITREPTVSIKGREHINTKHSHHKSNKQKTKGEQQIIIEEQPIVTEVSSIQQNGEDDVIDMKEARIRF